MIADTLFENGGGAFAAAGSFAAIGPSGRRGGRNGNGGRSGIVGCRFANCNGFRFSATAHLTSVNSRSQRTDHGQRHTSQGWMSSRIEKKMICALPMMFSAGT